METKTVINQSNLNILDALKNANIKIDENLKIKEYRLMYLWGAWVGHSRIYAESDEEAIFDADEIMKGIDNKAGFKYALVIGNRKVKEYKPSKE